MGVGVGAHAGRAGAAVAELAGAALATGLKVASKFWFPGEEPLLSTMGFLAVLLPVVAAGGLSWAAGQDYATRLHTYAEMVEFLESQAKRIELATSSSSPWRKAVKKKRLVWKVTWKR